MNFKRAKDSALTSAYDTGFEDGIQSKRTPRPDAIEAAITFWRLHNQSFHAYWQGMLDGVTAKST